MDTRLEVMDGKAMIVCMSRRICYELHEAIRKLRPDWDQKDDKGVMKIVMTGSASDPLAWQDHIRNKPPARGADQAVQESARPVEDCARA